LPQERQSAPSSTYLLPSAHVDAIFQYRVKRALPFSFTHSPTPIFLSFRLASSFFSRGERENGSEARNEKKGRKEPGGRRGRVVEAEVENESEELRLASAHGCNERTE